MKTNNKYILIALTLIVGIAVGWFIKPSNNQTVKESNHQASKNSVFTCSMHPQIRQNEPGDCPICGMDLIPVSNENSTEANPMAIAMSPTAMQLANVSTAYVNKGATVKSVRLNGKIQVDERLVFSQTSHTPGRIEKLFINFTGEYVSKGQQLASIYSPDLVNAQEELFEAEKIKETQPQLFNAAKEKLKNWKLTDNQIEQILKSGSPKEEFSVLADVSGYVTKKMVNLGDYIQRGEMIYEIADLSKVWALFDVYEADMVWIKKGDLVTFTVQSLPGEEFNGKLTYVDPVIDPKTRIAKARVELTNKDLRLKPEMFISGLIEAKLSMKNEAIVVPKTAIMWTGKRSVVYVKTTSEKGVSFLLREVTLGAALGDSYIVQEGLEPGEEIATNGTFSIDAAAQLAGKPSMMSPGGGPVMTGHNHGGGNTENTSKMSEQKSISINNKTKTVLQPLFNDYLLLKDALTKDDMDAAKKAAVNLQKTLSGINMSLFTGEAHNVWMKHSSNLNNSLQHVQHFKTIEELRKTFMPISNAMIDLVKAFNPKNETFYIDFCPMANDNKGAYWLSKEKEIKNPYFGSKMIKCGSVKETLPKK